KSRLAIEIGRAQLHPRDVAQAQHRPIGIRAHDDVFEFSNRGEAALGLDVQLQLLLIGNRGAPTRPTAAWTFCDLIALMMSPVVSPSPVNRSVLTQTRME